MMLDMRKTKTYKMSLCFSILLFLALVSVSCGTLNKKTANEAFLKEHPTYTITHSDTGEGWDGVVNYHFDYKKPNDERVYKEAWTFERKDDGTWKVTGRWTPKD
jgi:hypothetical protein